MLPPEACHRVLSVQELMEDIVEAEEEAPLDPADPAADQRARSGKGRGGRLGKLLYGAENPSWGYVPTC